MPPRKKKQRRRRPKPSATSMIALGLLGLPAVDAVAAGPGIEDKVERFKRNYTGFRKDGTFDFSIVLQTYGPVLAPLIAKKMIMFLGGRNISRGAPVGL